MTHAQQVILESHFAVEQPTRCWAGQIPPLQRDGRHLAASRDRGCRWMARRYADRGSRPQLPRPDEKMAGLVPRLRSRAGRVAEQLGQLGDATMPLEQRFRPDDPKTSAVHLAQPPAVEAETRCGAPSWWLRVSGRWCWQRDFMVRSMSLLRHVQLFLGSPARSTRPVARIDRRLAMALLSSNLLRRSGVDFQTRVS